MSSKLARLAGLFALGVVGLPGCPLRSGSKGPDASTDVPKPNPDGTPAVKTGPVVIATGHPRLLLRESDLPRLRSWATAGNDIFEKGLKPLVEQAAQTMDAGGAMTDDPASPNGYFASPPEALAMLFAFYSLVSPSLTERDAYAKRAQKLLMYVIDKALPGAAADQPFRDPAFSIGDR